MRRLFSTFCILLLAPAFTSTTVAAQRSTRLEVVAGTDAAGQATALWGAVLRRRLPGAELDSLLREQRPFTAEERAWAALVESRLAQWEREVAAVAAPYRPTAPPSHVVIVLGNRSASDAFTHDAQTIGFDLSALAREYGAAEEAGSADLMDRLFRHEVAHLMQKARFAERPYPMPTPLHRALAELWTEGLGNYHSLSARWRTRDGQQATVARQTLAVLEPRLVARLAALACAPAQAAPRLTADLSSGRFDRKWGAVSTALWLEAERARDPSALEHFVEAGPEGVWALAERHLDRSLRAVLSEAREAARLCTGG